MAQIVDFSIYAVVALGAAFGLILALVGLLHAGTLMRNELLPWTFYAIVIAIMAAPLATGRVLAAGLSEVDVSIEDLGSTFWLTRFLTVVVIAICIERCIRHILRKDKQIVGWPMWWCFFAFAISAQVLNGFLGAKPSFDHKGVYVLPLYFAFFVVVQREPERCFRFARGALLMFFVGSAAAAVIRPSSVIEFAYNAGLPGLNFRYHGLATHANTLGPLAIAFMIVLWRFPFPTRWINRLTWTLAVASLALSQSKTSLFIGIGIWLFLIIHQYRSDQSAAKAGKSTQFAMVLWTLAIGILALLVAGGLVSMNYSDWVVGKFDSIAGSQLVTLSGRTRIWDTAWHEFLAHPLFGYGPAIWDPEYRFYVKMPFAYHAHNQMLQSLSSAGAVGGLTLIAYATLLSIFALRSSKQTGGISVALVSLMLIRSVSEVPFATGNVMQSEFIVHLLALCACLGFVKQPEPLELSPTSTNNVPVDPVRARSSFHLKRVWK